MREFSPETTEGEKYHVSFLLLYFLGSLGGFLSLELTAKTERFSLTSFIADPVLELVEIFAL